MAGNGNHDKRIQAVEQRVKPARDAYWPLHVIPIVCARSSRFNLHAEDGGEQQPRNAAYRAALERAAEMREQTLAAVLEWVHDDAESFDYREDYYLDLNWPDGDDEPERCRFTVPWRHAHMSLIERALAGITTDGRGTIEWPDRVPEHGVLEPVQTRPGREPVKPAAIIEVDPPAPLEQRQELAADEPASTPEQVQPIEPDQPVKAPRTPAHLVARPRISVSDLLLQANDVRRGRSDDW